MENRSSEHGSESGNEFLVFNLGDEEYAIDILRVQEIRRYDATTKIANTPQFIKGVINLRGVIAPIVDIRIKLSFEKVVYDQFTAVIVLNLANRLIGMVVDGVSDVISLTDEQIKPAPALGSALDTRYIIGVGTIDQRMIILADVEKLMSSQDMGLIEQLAA
jgi:purine-binding chemotaxis protein CheW